MHKAKKKNGISIVYGRPFTFFDSGLTFIITSKGELIQVDANTVEPC